jgi:hypothetical protein
MDTNELPVADSAVGISAPHKGYAKWLEVDFHNVPDFDAVSRKSKIEAFYLGFLKGVEVIKGIPYKARFEWSHQHGKKSDSLDYRLIVYVSPPPTFPATRKINTLMVALDGDGFSDPPGPDEDDIDPPRPPAPPPPTM